MSDIRIFQFIRACLRPSSFLTGGMLKSCIFHVFNHAVPVQLMGVAIRAT